MAVAALDAWGVVTGVFAICGAGVGTWGDARSVGRGLDCVLEADDDKLTGTDTDFATAAIFKYEKKKMNRLLQKSLIGYSIHIQIYLIC